MISCLAAWKREIFTRWPCHSPMFNAVCHHNGEKCMYNRCLCDAIRTGIFSAWKEENRKHVCLLKPLRLHGLWEDRAPFARIITFRPYL